MGFGLGPLAGFGRRVVRDVGRLPGMPGGNTNTPALTAPAATTTPIGTPAPPPGPSFVSAAFAAARIAGEKARKRAAGGSSAAPTVTPRRPAPMSTTGTLGSTPGQYHSMGGRY